MAKKCQIYFVWLLELAFLTDDNHSLLSKFVMNSKFANEVLTIKD